MTTLPTRIEKDMVETLQESLRSLKSKISSDEISPKDMVTLVSTLSKVLNESEFKDNSVQNNKASAILEGLGL